MSGAQVGGSRCGNRRSSRESGDPSDRGGGCTWPWPTPGCWRSRAAAAGPAGEGGRHRALQEGQGADRGHAALTAGRCVSEGGHGLAWDRQVGNARNVFLPRVEAEGPEVPTWPAPPRRTRGGDRSHNAAPAVPVGAVPSASCTRVLLDTAREPGSTYPDVHPLGSQRCRRPGFLPALLWKGCPFKGVRWTPKPRPSGPLCPPRRPINTSAEESRQQRAPPPHPLVD